MKPFPYHFFRFSLSGWCLVLLCFLTPAEVKGQAKTSTGSRVPVLHLKDPADKDFILDWKGDKWRILLWVRDDTRFHLVLGDFTRLFVASSCLREKGELWVIFPGKPRKGPALEVEKFSGGGNGLLPIHPAFDSARKNWDAFGIIATPTTQLVDPKGVLKFQLAGCPQDLLERMAGVLKKKMGIDTPFEKLSGKKKAGEETPEVARFVSTARKLLAKGMPGLAARILEKALEGRPPDLSAGGLLGFLYLKRGEIGRARKIFLSLAKGFPSSPDPKLGLAACLVTEGKLDEAEAELAALERLKPASARLVFFRGVILEKRGDLKKAAERYKKAFLLVHPELGR